MNAEPHPGDKYLISDDRMENLEPINVIARELGESEKQLTSWATRRETNDFPPPIVTMGRYHLYDKVQVKNWVRLWKKVNASMGNKGLTGGDD